MPEEKKSSNAAIQPTDGRLSGHAAPTLHEARVNTEPVTQTDLTQVPDEVLIESLGVSKEMQEVLKIAIKKPNFITISYVTNGGRVESWWQTRQFPDEQAVDTLQLLHDDAAEKLLGKQPLARNMRTQLQAGRRPTRH